MPTVLGVKYGTIEGDFTITLQDNIIVPGQAFKACYLVIADNINQDPTNIKVAPGVPQIGTTLYGSYCNQATPRERDTVIHPVTGVLTTLYEVDCSFTTHMRNPTDSVPQVNWNGEVGKEALEFDLITGQKITTKADEPLFIDRTVVYDILEIRRREAYPYDPLTKMMYQGKVNSIPFWGYPAGSGFMYPIAIEEDTQDNQRIVWATYRICFKTLWNFDGTLQPDPWQAHLLNQGLQYREAIGGRPVQYLDKYGHPSKVNLDGNGLRLLDSSGTKLKIFGSAPGSLNPSKGVGDDGTGTDPRSQPDNQLHPIGPTASDIGSTMILTAGPANLGSYKVIGVASLPGSPGAPRWILDGDPGTIGISGITWQLQRCPIFLTFNRAYRIDFNQLSLGPF